MKTSFKNIIFFFFFNQRVLLYIYIQQEGRQQVLWIQAFITPW